MVKDSPIKLLLMGDLSVLKNDDPALIDEFLDNFQSIASKKHIVADMMFIRACHYNSVKVVRAMIEKDLISGIDLFDQTAVRAAIFNDSGDLIECLKEHGSALSTPDHKWIIEAGMQGAISCLPAIIEAMRAEGMDQWTFIKALDKCTVQLVRNEKKKSAETIITGLNVLLQNGASLPQKANNLLSNAVLAHRYSDMTPVVDYLLAQGVSEPGIKAAKSALSNLVSDIRTANLQSSNGSKFDPVSHFKTMKDRIEQASTSAGQERKWDNPLASLP